MGIQSIELTITRTDDTGREVVTKASLGPEGSHQWGGTTPELGATVDLVEALQEAAGPHFLEASDGWTPWTVEVMNEPHGEGNGWELCADDAPGALFYPTRENDGADATERRCCHETREAAQAECDRLNGEA